MSIIFSVYFKTKESIEQVVESLENLWTIRLKEDEEFKGDYRYTGFGLFVTILSDHETIDDMGINFSDYQHEIIIKTFMKETGSYTFVESMALWMAHQLHEVFGWPSIVVVDSQELILELKGQPFRGGNT